jgi:hypothetical protein
VLSLLWKVTQKWSRKYSAIQLEALDETQIHEILNLTAVAALCNVISCSPVKMYRQAFYSEDEGNMILRNVYVH